MCICTWRTKGPEEELLNRKELSKILKTLQSTDYITHGMISWIAISDSRKKNTFHSYCSATQKTYMLPCRDPLQNRTFISEYLQTCFM